VTICDLRFILLIGFSNFRESTSNSGIANSINKSNRKIKDKPAITPDNKYSPFLFDVRSFIRIIRWRRQKKTKKLLWGGPGINHKINGKSRACFFEKNLVPSR
jgi:hypothetical protein